jgi:sulfofructose kinase
MRVVALGHATLDHVFGTEEVRLPPAKLRARTYARRVGGMGAVAALAARAAGAEVAFIGRVGDDPSGEAARERLSSAGIDTTRLRAFEHAQTPVAAVLVDARGERLTCGYRGSALPGDASWFDVPACDAVCTDPRWPPGAARILQEARARGVPSVLDAELTEGEILEGLVPLASHAVFSESGLAAWRPGPPEQALRIAVSAGATIAAVTRGERGVLCWDGSSFLELPSYRVEVRDTTGAGDTYHGALAAALAAKLALPDALRFAAAAAAVLVSRAGPDRENASRAEIEDLIARQPLTPRVS